MDEIKAAAELTTDFGTDLPLELKGWCAKASATLAQGPATDSFPKTLQLLDRTMADIIIVRLANFVASNTSVALNSKKNSVDYHDVKKAVSEGAFKHKQTDERQKSMAKWTAPEGNPPNPSGDPFRKVLQSALEVIEKMAQISYPKEKSDVFHPYFVGLLSKEKFRETVASGRQWKDVGASPAHGEFTHRLQWLIVATTAEIPIHQVGQMYRDIGTFGTTAKTQDRLKQDDLWSRLFDRPQPLGAKGDAIGKYDFRCPEMLHEWLRNQHNKYPLLAGFLSARYEKRTSHLKWSMENFPTTTQMCEYTANKVLGKTYADLTPPQKQIVDDIMKEGVIAKL